MRRSWMAKGREKNLVVIFTLVILLMLSVFAVACERVKAPEPKRKAKVKAKAKTETEGETKTKLPNPYNVDISKFIPADSLKNHKVYYHDLDLDGTIEIVLAYSRRFSKGEPQARVAVFGWNGQQYVKKWESENTGGEYLSELVVRDINQDKIPEILASWVVGAHSSILYLFAYKEGTYYKIKDFFADSGIEVRDEDADGSEEILTSDREYRGVEGDSLIVTVYKWRRNTYRIWEKYRETPALRTREELE